MDGWLNDRKRKRDRCENVGKQENIMCVQGRDRWIYAWSTRPTTLDLEKVKGGGGKVIFTEN